MELRATDLSARLLATENLTVVRAPVESASFDIKSRVLTLPMWKEMTPEIEDMLVGHEVGHALYTDDRYLEPIKENTKLQSYLNIVEDVRIEKLIKRKYPGLRKRMNEGYKQLNDRDFFGISKIPLDELLLIDKINLYFKAGFQCGVKFDADEKDFVNRAERTETVEEVIQLAKDIFIYSKEKAEKEHQQRQSLRKVKGEDDEDLDEEMLDSSFENEWDDEEDEDEDIEQPEGDNAGRSGDNQPTSEKNDDEPDVESKTERAFAERLESLADQSTRYVYHKIWEQEVMDHVVGFKQVLKDTVEIQEPPYSYYLRAVYGDDTEAGKIGYEERHQAMIQKFKADSSSAVNYLVKEFEMKKSAQLMKRAQISKIGSLDMRKVYAYKLQDDLFKRVTSIPNGKNHGMIFLIDWSGSMADVIMDTLKQVINLCMFCNKAQIPYRVLGFTSQYNISEDQRRKMYDVHDAAKSSEQSYFVSWNNFHLLELFSSRMSMTEFNTMVKRVLDPRFFWAKGYDLGGTPLNEALIWCYNNIGKYMKENRIEKMNLITLSDGAGCSLQTTKRMIERDYVNGKTVRVKNLVREEHTKKTYEVVQNSQSQTEVILKMIKDRYSINVVGFFVCPNRRGALGAAVRDNMYMFNGDMDSMITSMRKQFKEHGFYSMGGTGRDDLFILPVESTKIDESNLTINSNMTSKALAKSLGKFLNTKKTSRVLLSRFIEYVA